MLFAPIFGYLGDRFPRKYVIAIGILIWSGMTLAGSFVDKSVSNYSSLFMLLPLFAMIFFK